MGTSPHPPHRLNPHDDLALHQRRCNGNLRPRCRTRRTQRHRRPIMGHDRRSLQSCHRMQLPLRRFLRAYMGTSQLGLPTRALPTPSERHGRCSLHLRKLGVQFRTRLFRASSVREYPVESLYRLWSVLCGDDSARLFHVP